MSKNSSLGSTLIFSKMRCITGPAVPFPASATSFHPPLKMKLRRDLVYVRRNDVDSGQAAVSLLEVPMLDQKRKNFLDTAAMQSIRAANA